MPFDATADVSLPAGSSESNLSWKPPTTGVEPATPDSEDVVPLFSEESP